MYNEFLNLNPLTTPYFNEFAVTKSGLDQSWRRYSLFGLFMLTASVAIPLGLAIAWGPNKALFLCIVGTVVAFALTHRRIFAVAAGCYVAALVLMWIAVVYDLSTTGPYVRWYNERLERISIEAGLIGTTETRVEEVLGPASYIWEFPNGNRTFNYAPYPSVPAAKFQVHCHSGKVQSIELYDD